jgi:hypothetical protein
VIDLYAEGHLVQAERMYPVESVVERASYFTWPSGGVEVRVVT